MTHPSLAAEHLFKADGDAANLTVDPPASGFHQRMALVDQRPGRWHPRTIVRRPISSARYLTPRLIPARTSQVGCRFSALVQGIDFSGIAASTIFTGGDPTALVDAGDGVTLVPTGSIVVTFDVVLDPDLAPAITQIQNTATITTDQEGPLDASVTDDVIRLGVVVEYNNAGFVEFDAVSASTVTYAHEVINSGLVNDSYQVTAFSELGFANPAAGWVVELIDPDSGATIATDTDFTDGTWDGGITVNTGSLAPGALIEYEIRVTVPAGTRWSPGEHDTDRCFDHTATVSEIATDETFVVGQGDLDGMAVLPTTAASPRPAAPRSTATRSSTTPASQTPSISTVGARAGGTSPSTGTPTTTASMPWDRCRDHEHPATRRWRSQRFFAVVDVPRCRPRQRGCAPHRCGVAQQCL